MKAEPQEGSGLHRVGNGSGAAPYELSCLIDLIDLPGFEDARLIVLGGEVNRIGTPTMRGGVEHLVIS